MRNNFSLLILVLILAMSLVSSASAADENGITLIQPTGGTVSYTIKDIIGDQFQDCIYLSNTPDDGYRFVRYIVKDTSGNYITLTSFTDLVTGETSYYFVKQDASYIQGLFIRVDEDDSSPNIF